MEEDTSAGQEGGGADVGQLIAQTDKNLAMLAQAAGSGGLPPEVAQAFQQASEIFRSAVETALAGAEGGAPPPGAVRPEASGMASPESGGKPGARPMSMGG
ncbi:MAG: hypothetical protein V4750_02695 [Pseudomonadota bacterium]